jgi:uncharacterized repeat protein (TIGR03803 family)
MRVSAVCAFLAAATAAAVLPAAAQPRATAVAAPSGASFVNPRTALSAAVFPGQNSTGFDATLFSFGGTNGSLPSSLTRDAAGNMYGTTFTGGLRCGCGTVFKLSHPTPNHPLWTQTVLHEFAGGLDGIGPDSALLIDAYGALYGTTANGGTIGVCIPGCGTVFKLTPPQAGGTTWAESILHTFSGVNGDGISPVFANLLEVNGALLGTTSTGGSGGGGTIFELSPGISAGTAWAQTNVHAFPNKRGSNDGGSPNAGLIAVGGAFYGTTTVGGGNGCGGIGCGTVYRLTPPTAVLPRWTETVIHSFNGTDGSLPALAIVADATGALYGTTVYGGDLACSNGRGCGTVYKLTPPLAARAPWTVSMLRFFHGTTGYLPYSGLISDTNGNLYGSTEGGGTSGAGTIFKLTASTRGAPQWTTSTIGAFSDGSSGGFPAGNLVLAPSGAIYGVTSGGGLQPCACGVVFSLAP